MKLFLVLILLSAWSWCSVGETKKEKFFKFVDKRSCVEFKIPIELRSGIDHATHSKRKYVEGENTDYKLSAYSNFNFKHKFSLSFNLIENSDSVDFNEFIKFKGFTDVYAFNVDNKKSIFEVHENLYQDGTSITEHMYIPVSKERIGLSPNYLTVEIQFDEIKDKNANDGIKNAEDDLTAIRELFSEMRKNIHYVKCQEWPERKSNK